MKSISIAGIILMMSFISFRHQGVFERKDKLSEYKFFQGTLADLNPVEGVVPYDVNTPLFSNYAEKLRFVKIPEGKKATYNDTSVFDFPVGTIFIKNFYYFNNYKKKEKGKRIVETRLLVHEEDGWNAFPYVWNEDQTDAYYTPAGETTYSRYVDNTGRKVVAPYVIPNKNQCKGCHIRGESMMPIGPSSRSLNRKYAYLSGTKNQLVFWHEKGLLEELPALSSVPKLPVWNDPATGSLDSRARAYLDINCGHCHRRLGPASTSGLFLDIYEKDSSHLGINKTPVAAGRGAGTMQVDIAPGQPGNSILVYRMKALDPAIAMPEIGREQIHKEGVALIEEWIKKMPPQ